MAAGGYDYDFCSTIPERIVCKICQCPSRDPYLSLCCGHVFCKTCIDQMKKATATASNCPMCRDEEFPTVPNKQINREVRDLVIFCTNKNNGCSWNGEIRAVEAHRKLCPLEEVECEYHSVGCKIKVQRKDVKSHNKINVENHLALSTSKLKNLDHLLYLMTMGTICDTDDDDLWPLKLEPLAMMAASGDKACPVIIKMPQFAAKKAAEEKWFSDPFYTHNKGYRMCLCVDMDGFNVSDDDHNDDHSDDSDSQNDPEMSVSLFLQKGPYDNMVKWPMRGEFEVKLLNQFKDSYHHEESIDFDDDTPTAAAFRVTDDEIASIGFGDEEFISYSDFDHSKDEDPDCLYLKDDCIFFQVSFEISD